MFWLTFTQWKKVYVLTACCENFQAMISVSWEEFLECANKIINTSNRLCDDWNLEGNPEIQGGAYLKKIKYLPDKRNADTYLRWEYHVCYSVNYAVPVLYFNVCDSSGSILILSDVWQHCKELYDYKK